MPYFQRPPVDRAHRLPGRAGNAVPAAPPVLAALAPRPLLDRITAILASAPAVAADPFDGQPPAAALPCAPPPTACDLWLAPHAPSTEDVPRLHPDRPARAGQIVSLPMTLACDDTGAELTLDFRATDLLSSSGDLIPAAQVAFAPARLALAAGTQQTVHIQIAVPAGVRAGGYAGLIQAVGDPVQAVISIDVTG